MRADHTDAGHRGETRRRPSTARVVIALSPLLALVAKVALQLRGSSALDGISVVALETLAVVALVAPTPPWPAWTRTGVGCCVIASALCWFADVRLGHLEPGMPHRSGWLVAIGSALAAAVVLWAVTALAWKRERV